MGTATTVAVFTAVNAANTAANAQRAAQQRADCAVYMGQFEGRTATVEQSRAYAECSRAVYGTGRAIAPFDLLCVQAALVLAVVGLLAGAFKGWREDGPAMSLCMGFLGLMAPPCVIATLWFLVKGLMWAFGQ